MVPTKASINTPAGITAAMLACLVLVAAVSYNPSPVVPYMDDWDYSLELSRGSLLDFALVVNPAGQFNPVYKFLYGSVLLLSNGSTAALFAVVDLVRTITLGLWLVIFRRLGVLSAANVFLPFAIALSYVGVVGVFPQGIQGGQELAFCLLTLSIYILSCRSNLGLLDFAGLYCAEVGAALSWANGLVVPFSIPLAFFLTRGDSGRVKSSRGMVLCLGLAALTVLAIRLATAEGKSTLPNVDASAFIGGVASYFFYGGIVNGALSGLNPQLLPGWMHLFFYLSLLVGTARLLSTDESRGRRFVALSLLSSQILIAMLTALVRWRNGPAHASSYRYVYNNVFLELILVSLLVGCLWDTWQSTRSTARTLGRVLVSATVALTICLGVTGWFRGRADWELQESTRRACLSDLLAGKRDESCLATFYYRNDPDYVLRAWQQVRTMRRGQTLAN